MATHALRPDYHGEFKDSADRFHGAIIVYIAWDKHLMFYSARAFPLDPNMPFGAVVEHVLPEGFGQHPNFKNVDWSKVTWRLNHEEFTPDFEKSLADNGFDHKCILRFDSHDHGIAGMDI